MAGSGIALAQDGQRQLNPRTESKVDTKNPDRGPLLILDGEKDHGSLGGRQRRLQAAEAQPERHRDQEDAQPRPLADHRPRLAGGRADRARLRQAVRPGQAELAGIDLLAGDSPPRYYGVAVVPDYRDLGRGRSRSGDFDIRSLVPHGQG